MIIIITFIVSSFFLNSFDDFHLFLCSVSDLCSGKHIRAVTEHPCFAVEHKLRFRIFTNMISLISEKSKHGSSVR